MTQPWHDTPNIVLLREWRRGVLLSWKELYASATTRDVDASINQGLAKAVNYRSFCRHAGRQDDPQSQHSILRAWPQGCRLPLRVLVSSSPADILIDIFTNSALVGQPSSSFVTDAGDRTQNLHLVNEVLKLCIMLLNQQMFRLFRPVPGLCDSHLYGFSRADLRPERKYRVVKFVDHDIIRRCCCKEHLFPKLHSHLCLFQRLNSSFSTLQRRFVMTAQFWVLHSR